MPRRRSRQRVLSRSHGIRYLEVPWLAAVRSYMKVTASLRIVVIITIGPALNERRCRRYIGKREYFLC